MRTAIGFLRTGDGIRIAYCTHGEGPPLVFVRGWISHLELLWSDPAFRSYFGALARHFCVIRYDARGNGLSQRQVPKIDLEGLVLDVEALVDELKLTDITLYGATFGGPIAVIYAARHPERIAKLILDGTYACGREIASRKRQAAILSMIRDDPGFTFEHLMAHLTHPEPEQAPYRRAHIGEFVSPEVAARLYALCYEIDVSALLPQIRAPTLVLHRQGSRSIPFRLGLKLAALIPNALFVPLEGTAHNSWEGDATAALAAVADFLAVRLPPPPISGVQGPLTILFTDISGSTALTQRLGDARAQELLHAHNAIVRDALRAHGGSEIKHTGDGIMASFVSASGAVRCAVTIQQEAAAQTEREAEMPLRVRIGLNAGEPVVEEQDVFGSAVQLASRLCDRARPGEILVSDVVRQLVAGKGFVFVDHGSVVLRCFEEQVRLFGVEWQA